MNDAAAFKMASAGAIATRDRQLAVLWAVAVVLLALFIKPIMIDCRFGLPIFLVLVQSVIALYVFDTLGREQVARKFDRIWLIVILAGYVVVSVALPLAARPL